MMALHNTALHILNNKRLIILRLGVVSGSLFLAMAIGLMTARGRPDSSMILAATIAPIGFLILYRLARFEYGVLALVLAAGLVNFFEIPTGTESPIVVSLLVGVGLIGVWLLQLLLIDKRIQLKPSPINKPVLIFVTISIVAYVWSNLFRDPLVYVWGSFPAVQLAALVVNISLPMLALLVSNKIEEGKWLKWLTWMMIGMGAVWVVSELFHLPIIRYILKNGSRGLFVTWVGALAYGLALFHKGLPRWVRGLLLVLLAACLYRNFFLGRSWVSGWLPLGIACVVLTLMRSKRLFIVATLLGLLFLGINFDLYWQSIVVANEEEGSGTGRVELWQRNIQHVVNHPLFGMGPAGYAVYNMTYHPEDARSTHNNYFDILSQTGIIGFGVFLWLLVAFIRIGGQTRRALAGRRNFEEAFAGATLAGCIAAVVAMMLGDWVLPFAYNQGIAGFDYTSYTWIFLGGVVSLHHIVHRRDQIKQPA